MNVGKLMTIDPARRGPSDSLADAAQDMWNCDCGCVPVVDEQQNVLGMITDRDICMAAYFQGRPLREIPIGDVMARTVLSCRAEDSVGEAERIMREAKVRRLPVTDPSGRLLGIISLNDIACEAEAERTSRTPQVSLGDVALTLSAVGQQRGSEAIARFGDGPP